MNKIDIQQMTPESLIKLVHHELNQKSAATLSLATALLEVKEHEAEHYNQTELLSLLKSEAKAIRIISDTIRIWLATNCPTNPKSELTREF